MKAAVREVKRIVWNNECQDIPVPAEREWSEQTQRWLEDWKRMYKSSPGYGTVLQESQCKKKIFLRCTC